MAKHIPGVQHKRGTAAAMAAHNITLGEGEFGVEIDTLKIKVGNGTDAWNFLPYVGSIRIDTLENLQTDDPSLQPKELAIGFDPEYDADSATGQYVIKLNTSTTQETDWSVATTVPLVPSNTTGITGAGRVTNIVSMSAAQYASLATKNASTLYIIVD